MKLGMISLGCAKNLVDSELFLGVAKKYNLEITNNIKKSDIIVINTCGFIESAKKEAIDTILDVVDLNTKKKVIVMGCLVQRYFNELKESIPEVDFYFPIKDYEHIDLLFKQLTSSDKSYHMNYNERLLTTKPHSAYIRISEGCDNRCSYCAIPLIRGPFKSRPFEEIITEAKVLASIGVKEITLIGQDTTRYGTDLKQNKYLNHLLHELSQIDEIELIRVLYLYPDELTDEVIQEIKSNNKVAKYFDLPIQHASNKILKAMNRRGDKDFITNLIAKIRHEIPNAILRTTFIVGFPSETNEDFEELIDFIKTIKFNRLGCFTYSDEEDTKGFSMTPKVDTETMNKRLEEVMRIQQDISLEKNKQFIGQEMTAFIEDVDYENNSYTLRNSLFAPDDVDGYIYATSNKHYNVGDTVNIEILEASIYDLKAKIK